MIKGIHHALYNNLNYLVSNCKIKYSAHFSIRSNQNIFDIKKFGFLNSADASLNPFYFLVS